MVDSFDDLFLEPSKYYKGGLETGHEQVIDEYVEELVRKSGIDVEGNKQTAKEIVKAKEDLEKIQKSLNKTSRWSTFLLVVGIILAVAIIGIFILIYRSKKVKTKEKDLISKRDKQQKKVNELINKSREEIAPFMALLNDYMSTDLINKSAPFIKFNHVLSPEFLQRMIEQFKYEIDLDARHSSLVIQSGTMRNNPFIIRQYLEQRMVPHIYTGSLVITWTETVRASDGTRTVTRTQTLVAHYTEDEPVYSVCSELVYCNDACPKLSFSRSPTELYKMNEKQLAKYIANFEKEDNKKAAYAVKHGQSYTKMTNSKFEAYWNSKGRNDEVGYRLMFTPLAQTNITHLFSLDKPYGDDIYYTKKGMVNFVCSKHSQSMDYSGGTYNYSGDTFEEVEYKFKSYNSTFFRGMIFDFMPLISIPIFHQNISAPFLGSDKVLRNVTQYEAEVMANKMDTEQFKHPASDTDIIIEAKVVSKGNGYDNIEIIGRTFEAVPQVALVPTLGGDGEMHPVPVNYYIYEPLEKVTKARAYKNLDSIPSNHGNILKYKDLALEIIE